MPYLRSLPVIRLRQSHLQDTGALERRLARMENVGTRPPEAALSIRGPVARMEHVGARRRVPALSLSAAAEARAGAAAATAPSHAHSAQRRPAGGGARDVGGEDAE